MNQCHFLGRLVADPELRNIAGGDKRVVNFRIAVDRRYKRNKETAKETAFLDCEAWDTGADQIVKHFHKGDAIIVHASVKQEEWEDKNSGGRRSKLKFRVNSFDFPPGNKKNNGNDEGGRDSDNDGYTNEPDSLTPNDVEDIPF